MLEFVELGVFGPDFGGELVADEYPVLHELMSTVAALSCARFNTFETLEAISPYKVSRIPLGVIELRVRLFLLILLNHPIDVVHTAVASVPCRIGQAATVLVDYGALDGLVPLLNGVYLLLLV